MKSKVLRAGRLLCAVLGAVLCSPAHAATVSIISTADTGTFEDFPDNNLGRAGAVSSGTLAGNLGNTGASRMLVKFDLTGSVPEGAVVQSARVSLRVTKIPTLAVSSTFELHRLLVNWGEGTKAMGATTGSGSAASTGEATWNSRFHNQTDWADPGGLVGSDYAVSASATAAVSGVATYSFASSPAMIADVQGWVDQPASNHGWILISAREGTLRTARRFATREATTPSTRPTLTIDFVPPPPLIEEVVLVNGDIRMRFMAHQGMSYQVQRRPAVDTGPWMTFTNVGPVAASMEVTIADPASERAQFYQVVETGL